MIRLLFLISYGVFGILFGLTSLYFFYYPSKGILRIRELERIKTKFSHKQLKSKRLILGGSDVLYSFDTEKMNRELPIQTVNLGTNVGLGLGYLLEYGKELAKPGDQIIACLAYSLYTNPPYYVFSFDYYRMFDRKKLARFSFTDFIYYLFANLAYNFSYVQREFVIGESGCYLNVRGSQLAIEKDKPLVFPTTFNVTASLSLLEEFKVYCLENQIDLAITYPSTLEFTEYRYSAYLQQLTEYLTTNYQVIGTPEAYFVPRNKIFNSVYHINEEGQLARTEKLIESLLEREGPR